MSTVNAKMPPQSSAVSAHNNPPTLSDELSSTYRSQHSPIEYLPSDLFVIIVTLVLKPTGSFHSPGKIEKLRLVCKRWCQVIDSVPGLWNTLHSISTTLGLSAALDRSGDLPLDIVYNKAWSRRGMMAEHYQRSLENMAVLLVPQSARWRSLSIKLLDRRIGFDDRPKLEDVRNCAMPNLERLKIDGCGMEVVQWDDFGSQQPRLQSLKLRTYSIPWESKILLSGTLRYLHISRIRRVIPTARAISAILSSSSHLVTLEIDARSNFILPITRDDIPVHATPILLPELSTLCFDLELTTLVHLLRRLQIPACTQLKIKATKYASPSDGQINLAVESLQARLASASADVCNRITILADRDYFHIITDSGYMDIRYIRSYGMLRMFMGIYPGWSGIAIAAPQRNVTLEWKGFNWMAIARLMADEEFSKSVTSMILHGGAAEDVQPILGSLMENVDGEKQCPNLRYLQVEYHSKMAEDIIRFVGQRCVDSDGSEFEDARLPVQLCLVGGGTLFDREMEELASSNGNVTVDRAMVL